ncbi:PREDICTED: LRR receptor [Prunus dulcis]|uniref:PREDICTED: LRR receptor n=1 Tax=Prunus dulcis TaxID=3755 RepID=A0A5E4F2S8_PRUDU|nr:hypothetical protein L3X38_022559 [Prunus dulcis]VVA22116.1 PREDICTED: LRR receptor [Prunus dulcis]
MKDNNFRGEIPSSLKNSSFVMGIYLGGNQLTGNVPSWIDSNMPQLSMLRLRSNSFKWTYPRQPWPHWISSLTFLSHLNLSYNNLNGRIPSGSQLQVLENDWSVYKGNPSLCGVPLTTKCLGDDSITPNKDPEDKNEDDEDDKGVVWFYASLGLGFIVGCWGVCGTLVLKKSWRYAYFRIFDGIKDKVALASAFKVARLQRKS